MHAKLALSHELQGPSLPHHETSLSDGAKVLQTNMSRFMRERKESIPSLEGRREKQETTREKERDAGSRAFYRLML